MAVVPVQLTLHDEAIKDIGNGQEALNFALHQLEPVVEAARRAAPVSKSGSHGRSPGYLARNVQTEHGNDSAGLYFDVVSKALAPDGFPYGALQEVRRPYIRPQIEGRTAP
jgi:hypothetical protein